MGDGRMGGPAGDGMAGGRGRRAGRNGDGGRGWGEATALRQAPRFKGRYRQSMNLGITNASFVYIYVRPCRMNSESYEILRFRLRNLKIPLDLMFCIKS